MSSQLYGKKLLNKKFRIIALLIISTVLFVSGCGGGGEGKTVTELLPEKPLTGQAGDNSLDEVVDYIRIDAGLPALAAVMVHDGQIIEMSATGTRSIDAAIAVTTEDKLHLGSITKSMSSTLAAVLVKQGVINWDTTLAEVFPELLGVMHNSYESVRFEQLLSHTSGMRANIPDLNDYHNISLGIEAQRRQVVSDALVLSPEVSKGNYLYSNLGYMVAGAMMEKITGQSWEVLLDNNVFNVLGMTNSGYGSPDSNNNLTHPVGHQVQGSGWKAIVQGNTDNPAVLGPAGTVHSSLGDMGEYIAAHLAGTQGNDVVGLLTGNEFTKLHTPMDNSSYALGWGVTENTISHNGSNSMWLAYTLILPKKNLALFIVTNAADLQKQENSAALNAVNVLAEEMSKRADAAFIN